MCNKIFNCCKYFFVEFLSCKKKPTNDTETIIFYETIYNEKMVR